MTERDLILRDLPEGAKGVIPELFQHSRTPVADLWLEFEERLTALGGQVLPKATLPLLLSRGDAGFWADRDALPLLPRGGKQAVSIWNAEIGVCTAELAIAETGSLVLAAASGRWRLTSLAPPVNLVLVRESAIVGTIEEAFAQMPMTTSVVVTGTSRTADIEGVLVRGVHGPRELYVVKM
jgi:hypothetical protein